MWAYAVGLGGLAWGPARHYTPSRHYVSASGRATAGWQRRVGVRVSKSESWAAIQQEGREREYGGGRAGEVS